MGKLSISIVSHNIRNIIWNAQGLKTVMFVGIGETNYLGWTWTVGTRVTDIPLVLAFLCRFLKREPRIEDM